MKRKGSAVDALNHRLRRRMAAGIISEAILSNTIFEYCQRLRDDPDQLKSRKKEKSAFARRGAPFGNRNRLTNGDYTLEMKQLRADVYRHVERVRALVERIDALPAVIDGE